MRCGGLIEMYWRQSLVDIYVQEDQTSLKEFQIFQLFSITLWNKFWSDENKWVDEYG